MLLNILFSCKNLDYTYMYEESLMIVHYMLGYNFSTFPDGESSIVLTGQITKKIVLSRTIRTGEDVFGLQLLFDGLQRKGCEEVILQIPYLGYLRQDRVTENNHTCSAEVILKMLEHELIKEIQILDPHSERCFGKIKTPIRSISANSLFTKWIQKNITGDSVILSPDAGGVGRAEQLAKHVGAPGGYCEKQRDNTGKIISMRTSLEVDCVSVCIVDDMIDSGGTICRCAELCKKKGAIEIYVISTHAVFSGSATERLESFVKQGIINRVVVTDSLQLEQKERLEILPSQEAFT